ncbi:MAG: type II toxin-antitoxin system VapC family toxin [Cyanobium sp. MAG06]|nr:type II toxin-antitoxin system VapC family toxin [Cyanobium sp. MAG06]
MYTLDTNIIIYLLNRDEYVSDFIFRKIKENININISSITITEALSLSSLTVSEMSKIENMLNCFTIINVDINVSKIASQLRRDCKIKTPDAIIAATAIYSKSVLVTRNIKDFKKIKNLTILEL